MSKPSTEENEKLVHDVYSMALSRVSSGGSLDEADRIVYEIEGLSQEVNSGASYEQYFRWTPVSEIRSIVARLQEAGLPEEAELTQRAIEVAFPQGIPRTDDEKDDLTDWSDAQDAELCQLADQLTDHNERITNALAARYRHLRGGL